MGRYGLPSASASQVHIMIFRQIDYDQIGYINTSCVILPRKNLPTPLSYSVVVS